MADTTVAPTPAPTPGAPSDVLMALYMGDRDKAATLALGVTLTLPELAAFGDAAAVAAHVQSRPADLHTLSGDGWTALHLAAFFGHAHATVVLLRAGASHAARAQNAQGNTPLHAALAGRCDLPVVAALLAAGADAVGADVQGYTPLHLAASRGNRDLAELLLTCGARADTTTPGGKTAADIARERNHPDVADWLAQR